MNLSRLPATEEEIKKTYALTEDFKEKYSKLTNNIQ